jgi:hypothetical protein
MTQINELKNGIDKFAELRNIIIEADTKIEGIRIKENLYAFINKVEHRISNKKRIDLYCYDEKQEEKVYPPNEAQESWVIVGINENGICSRQFKRTHMWVVDMVGQYRWRNNDKPQKIINTLKNTENNWIYNSLKDEAIKEVLQKYIAFLDKHFLLLNNADTNRLKYQTFKSVKLPTEFLNCSDYRGRYEVSVCNITGIKYNTDSRDILTLETDITDTNEIHPPQRIDLRSYKHFYLMEQNFDEFKNVLTEIKAELNEKSNSLNSLYNQLSDDVEQLKTNLGHIFVLDSL